MRKNYYKKGDYNVICASSGRKLKASQTRMRWDGFRVQLKDWERRHPQEFIRPRDPDIQYVNDPWPEQIDNFLDSDNEVKASDL